MPDAAVLISAFRAFAACDDKTLDKLMTQIGRSPVPRKVTKKKCQFGHFLSNVTGVHR